MTVRTLAWCAAALVVTGCGRGEPEPKNPFNWGAAIRDPGQKDVYLAYDRLYAETPAGSFVEPEAAIVRRKGEKFEISLRTSRVAVQAIGPMFIGCVRITLPTGTPIRDIYDGFDGRPAMRATPDLEQEVRNMRCRSVPVRRE